jgi:MinD-like ATPase involved in chromosome partitioning or flagellar assembly
MQKKQHTEIIAISSGKGGTGKTLIAISLGYALIRAGHNVLMIDGDPGTDGLSLAMLGPRGMKEIDDVDYRSTLHGLLTNYCNNPGSDETMLDWMPYKVNRTEDYDAFYHALLSGKNIYGTAKDEKYECVVPRLEKLEYRSAVGKFFKKLRSDSEFDYIIVDTRGGFAFESTELCALADSFVVVTEADYTSFYQDRNLLTWINKAADDSDRHPVLRGIIVNKATHGEEKDFRLALEKEFPVKYKDTYPIPLDVEAIIAYREQLIPFVTSAASEFSAAALAAFSRIMKLVTGGWDDERVYAWNELVAEVSTPYKKKHSFRTRAIRWGKRHIAVPITIVVFGILSVIQSVYLAPKGSVDPQLIENVYSEDLASYERINALQNLYESGVKQFHGIGFAGADLRNLELDNIDMNRADLSNAKLQNIHMEYAVLKNARLTNADMRGASLSHANFSGAFLKDANLNNAILNAVVLRGANMIGVNLTGASLRDADLSNVDLRGAILHDADLRGANLTDAKVLDSAIASAKYDDSTVLPKIFLEERQRGE